MHATIYYIQSKPVNQSLVRNEGFFSEILETCKTLRFEMSNIISEFNTIETNIRLKTAIASLRLIKKKGNNTDNEQTQIPLRNFLRGRF